MASVASDKRLHVFLINLEMDRERLLRMKHLLEQMGLSFTRLPAYTSKTIPEWIRSQFYGSDGVPYGNLGDGEIGCYSSHMEIMKRIVDDNIPDPILILEDDLEFASGFGRLLEVLTDLPMDWDIIRLSNDPKSPFIPIKSIESNVELVAYWRIPNNTGAYLINRKGAEKFLRAFNPRTRAIDEDMRRPWFHHMVTYGVLPSPIVSNVLGTSNINIDGQVTSPKNYESAGIRYKNLFAGLRYKFRQFGPTLVFRILAQRIVISIKKKFRDSDNGINRLRVNLDH
ncbi:MAG: glycosyltransferase family 25 protein [Candidatus Sedimenticola sp. (ex Thyasira tokunagai)]